MRVCRIAAVLPLVVFLVSCASETTPSAPAPPADTKGAEYAAILNLKAINNAQTDFIHRTRRYGQTFNELFPQQLPGVLSGESGYKFSMYPSPDAVSYTVKAEPVNAGGRHFFMDQTGVIRAEPDKAATVESPAISD